MATTWILLLSAVVAARVATSIGREFFHLIAADDSFSPPDWLEAFMPLKGRWLRIFLATPPLLVVSGLIFLVVYLMTVLTLAMLQLGLTGILMGCGG